MLRNLHVKDLALIREVDVDFAEGLNILTGETGAGKSILIGSIQLALGGRVPKELMRDGAKPAFVELVFDVTDKEILAELEEKGFPCEEGLLIISRRIGGGRSVSRIGGVTVPASVVRECAELLIDIHGQHENQTLLKPQSQLDLVDLFGGEAVSSKKERVRELVTALRALQTKAGDRTMSEEERLRRADFLRFEIDEIEEASLKEGEDEEVEALYKKLNNARRIAEAVGTAAALTGSDEAGAAGESIGRALREIESAVRYDEELRGFADSLSEIDSLLSDFNRDIADYLDNLSEDPSLFKETEERLNLINRLKAKFGPTLEHVFKVLDEKKAELQSLEDYEAEQARYQAELKAAEKALNEAAGELTAARKAAAEVFEREAASHFLDLNFDRADFKIEFGKKPACTENGEDEVTFLIATNPGTPLMPLKDVASGGELSRLMLGIRSMFASRDKTETLIFDEIDAGISGRTAQCVAEKLNVVGKAHQTLCITHLPQIAAMADHHYAIIKDVSEDEASTRIEALGEDASIDELARLIGGAVITDNTLHAAREMREQSLRLKKGDHL